MCLLHRHVLTHFLSCRLDIVGHVESVAPTSGLHVSGLTRTSILILPSFKGDTRFIDS